MTEDQALNYIKNDYEAFSSNENRNHLLKIFSKFNNEKFYEKAIEINPYFIKEINNPSYELCLKTVSKTSATVRWIPENILDDKICEIAVIDDWYNINLIPINFLTPELCLLAIDHYKNRMSRESEEFDLFDSEFMRVFCMAYACEFKTLPEAISKFKTMISDKNKKLIKETIKELKFF